MGTKIPKKGLESYDPNLHKYPEQIHHRVALGMDCGSYIGEGWYDIISELDDAISKIYPMYIVDQVKEKFGGLRYYIASLPEDFPDQYLNAIYNLIHEAECKSLKTCDVCGDHGETVLIDGFLLATRCDKHNKIR